MSRLTIELKAGVFVGSINRRVRERLWTRIVEEWHADALMIYTTNSEQGYAALSNGDTSRQLVEIEGITLTQFTRTTKNDDNAGAVEIQGQSPKREPRKARKRLIG